MLSCGADGSVRLWSPTNTQHPLLKTFGGVGESPSSSMMPTSVDWVYDEPTHLVSGYNTGACVIYDIETGKPVIKMDTEESVRIEYILLFLSGYSLRDVLLPVKLREQSQKQNG